MQYSLMRVNMFLTNSGLDAREKSPENKKYRKSELFSIVHFYGRTG